MAKEETSKKDYGKLKIIAEGMFVNQDMTAREIAETIGVSEVTISKWRSGEADGQSWDDKKNFIRITPARLREKILQEAEKVSRGEASIINADSIVKLLSAADKLAAKVTPETVYTVLKECSMYIATIDPEAALSMAEYHRLFLAHKIERETV